VKRRILYIEDDAESMALVQQLLEMSLPNVMVDVCSTEAGAENRLNTSCYDLIICDFSLPGAATGAVIAERVLARDPGQPFYLMSEYVGENVKAEAARVGLELHGKFSTVPTEVFVSRVEALLEQRPCVEATAEVPIDDCVDADSSKEVSGHLAESDESRASTEVASGAHHQERRARQVPSERISLRSPHVTAALMAMGRG
jgi:CheY-like chemotaxis protein